LQICRASPKLNCRCRFCRGLGWGSLSSVCWTKWMGIFVEHSSTFCRV
jgi:hypothetical protein